MATTLSSFADVDAPLSSPSSAGAPEGTLLAHLPRMTDHPVRSQGDRNYLELHETQEGQSLITAPCPVSDIPWARPISLKAWETIRIKMRHLGHAGVRHHRHLWFGVAATVPLGASVLHLVGHLAFANAFLWMELGVLGGFQGLKACGPWKTRRDRARQWAKPWCTVKEQEELPLATLMRLASERLEVAPVHSDQQQAWAACPATQEIWKHLQATEVPLLALDVAELNHRLPPSTRATSGQELGTSGVKQWETLTEQPARSLRPSWVHADELDLLSDQLIQHARLDSLNTITLASPYDQPTTVTLQVTHHARHGWKVALNLVEGEGMFDQLEEVTVRFDHAPMRQWAVKKLRLNKINLMCAEAFVDALRQANRVLIEAKFYPSELRLLQFEASHPLEMMTTVSVAIPLPATREEENDEMWMDDVFPED